MGALVGYDGVAFTGSSASAFWTHKADVTRQVALVKRCFDLNVSCFGSCWGIQIAAIAAGGAVVPSPLGREVGPGRMVCMTDTGAAHPMYAGKSRVFEAFMSHGDEVDIGTLSELTLGTSNGHGGSSSSSSSTSSDGLWVLPLAGNRHSALQAMAVGHSRALHGNHARESWFVQYHPEYDLAYFSGLIRSRAARMVGELGLFETEAACETYCDELLELHAAAVTPPEEQDAWTAAPQKLSDGSTCSRIDLAWKYGIGADLLNPDMRTIEARNWINYLLSHGEGLQ